MDRDSPLYGSLRAPLKIASIYLIVSVLWIVFSDRIVYFFIKEPALLTGVQTLKGWFFVFSTSFLIFVLLKRELKSCQTTAGRLRESRQELKDIMDAMPVGLILSDGVTIEYINVNFSERFGYSLDEIPTDEQWSLLAFPDPVYRESFIAAWRAASDTIQDSGTPIAPFEVKVTCKNGTIRHVIVNTQRIRNRVLVILTDITERELLQNELVKMQKLESIGVLAGGIAHDFNNILTGIMGNLSFALLLMDADHKAFSSIKAAEKASKRAAELTRQLLTFARGGQPIKKAISVHHLLREAVTLMLRGTNVKAEIAVDDGVQAVEADEGQVSQVFNNIVINAVQSMPDGGALRIRVGNEMVDLGNTLALSAGEYVTIAFADEGCGMPPEMLARVFDPYFSTKTSGSGLGLATAYSIITRHGGTIRADSLVGKETTFTVYLPATSIPLPEEPGEEDLRTADLHLRGAVLIMDDEQAIRTVALKLLKHLGYQVTTCADGATAVRLYADALAGGAPFSAAIMDLTIPGGMGGKEAARQILALHAEACLIVSSGYSHDTVMSEYPMHGFSGVLAKPYRTGELARVLDTVLAAKKSGYVLVPERDHQRNCPCAIAGYEGV